MKNLILTMLGALIACSSLAADSTTLSDLPSGDTDTISIQLTPDDGALDGVAGATVGWGFVVSWASTDADWVSFTGSSLGSLAEGETNPGILAPGGYTDFIGPQGGPVDFGLSPSGSPWMETFDGVSQGVGSYQIASDAIPLAEDTGQITFDFQVYNGDPLGPGTQQIGDASYTYYGPSTTFTVIVDAPVTSAPEPGGSLLLAIGLVFITGRLVLSEFVTGRSVARGSPQTTSRRSPLD